MEEEASLNIPVNISIFLIIVMSINSFFISSH